MSLRVNGFDLPPAAANAPLRRLLQSAAKSPLPGSHTEPNYYWDLTFWGLDRVRLFQEATPEEQHRIWAIANQDLLEEIYWVEQGGVGYMAKMSLLAETTEERLLYGLFAADEATHLTQIQGFLVSPPVFQGDHFLAFMGELIESSDKALLMTLVQVVLEGWGLSHYRYLAQNCLSPDLKVTLQGFLAAESRHHAAGVLGLQQWPYRPDSLDQIYEALSHFLQMVQLGPQRLLRAIAQGKGDLSRPEKIQILEELQTEVHSQKRLDILRNLMTGNVPPAILQKLDDQGSFKPYSAVQCVP